MRLDRLLRGLKTEFCMSVDKYNSLMSRERGCPIQPVKLKLLKLEIVDF